MFFTIILHILFIVHTHFVYYLSHIIITHTHFVLNNNFLQTYFIVTI